MTTALIAALMIGVLFLAKRWIDARSEVAALRTQVALLKRRLTRVER